MFKSIVKVIVIALVVIGGLNFHAMNKAAFKAITTTVTTKSLGEIPGGVIGTITSHQWKFVRS